MTVSEHYHNIAAIREYENSIDLPNSECKTYVDEQKRIHLKEGDDKATSPFYSHYAQKCLEYLRFGDDVDLATSGGMDSLNQLCVCRTPQLFRDAGFQDKPMLYTQRHLLDAIHRKSEENYHWHGLTVSQIKKLPELLENPVMLCDSPARKDVLLALLAEVDEDRLPLLVAIKPDGKGNYNLQEIETNFILSVYGKDNFARYFDERITPDKLIYFDKKQAHKLEALAELQLLRCHPIAYELDTIIIRKPQCLVNGEQAQKPVVSISSEVSSMQQAHQELSQNRTADKEVLDQSSRS